MRILPNILKCFAALSLGISAPALIWVGAGVAFIQSRKNVRQAVNGLRTLVCSIDSDCPRGHICIGGQCIPNNIS
ncbi:MAG: hypothetical protein V1767_06235 [Chloroflexota bacterium]